MPLYKEDLAYIHHAGFSDFAAGAAPAILASLKRGRPRAGKLVDLGCGGGILLKAATSAGWAGVGIDSSPAMLRIARRVAPRAKFEQGNVAEVELPRCDAVTALGEVFGYAAENGNFPKLARLFERIALALPHGGQLIFDMYVRTPKPLLPYRSWRAGKGWAVLVAATENSQRTRLLRHITSFRQHGHHYRRSDERHVVRIATREAVTGALERAGFRVRVRRKYGEQALAPRRLAFFATKHE